jgi:tryptophanase
MQENVQFFVSKFRDLMDSVPRSSIPDYYRPRPYRNAVVRFRKSSFNDFDERVRLVNDCGLNVFLFPAAKIPGCDLLTDSGTTTMTMEQWSQLFLGDEAYGSNEGYFDLKDQIVETLGPSWAEKEPTKGNLFIFHQGRAAEHALFTVLSRLVTEKSTHNIGHKLSAKLLPELKVRIEKQAERSNGAHFIIPSNSHFDTTEANISENKMIPINLPCREHVAGNENFPFRGNMDLEYLESLLENEWHRIPLVYITITNNTGGGQPVSLDNIQKARNIAHKYGVPIFFDACRFAENAWFIKQRAEQYKDFSIASIVKEMFECVDGFTISFKKDGLANIGGSLIMKDDSLFDKKYPDIKDRLTNFQILAEGHPTYGGLAGRDLKAIVEGLKTITKQDYLEYRIHQVERFGLKLIEYGIPIVRPIGGHAVYIDMDKFFAGNQTNDEDFKAIALTALLLIAGHRTCELGLYSFGKYVGGKEIPPDPRVNLVRIAIPRLVYEDNDLLAVAEVIKILFENRDRIPGVKVIHGRESTLRHFKSRFKFSEDGGKLSYPKSDSTSEKNRLDPRERLGASSTAHTTTEKDPNL